VGIGILELGEDIEATYQPQHLGLSRQIQLCTRCCSGCLLSARRCPQFGMNSQRNYRQLRPLKPFCSQSFPEPGFLAIEKSLHHFFGSLGSADQRILWPHRGCCELAKTSLHIAAAECVHQTYE